MEFITFSSSLITIQLKSIPTTQTCYKFAIPQKDPGEKQRAKAMVQPSLANAIN